MKKSMILVFAGALMMLPLGAQEWLAPDEEAARSNPMEYTLENVKQGKVIYTKNCKSCHGDPGKNNPLTLAPMPSDIASEKLQTNSEGELYYKITTGLGLMPSFESTLSENDRWLLVNFIQNYNPQREQLLLDLPPVKAKLMASVNEELGAVDIMAEYENAAKKYVPLLNAPVTISSKKAFGSLEIGKAITNDQGRATYVIPEHTMGDEEGYISVHVSLTEEYEVADVILEKALVGTPKGVPGLIRKGVLWSTNNNVSLWILLPFILVAGGAWIVIGYVILQIVKIKRSSESS